MSDWTTTIRAALAAFLGLLSLLASFCDEGSESPATPVIATVSDQPARVIVTDEQAPLELESAGRAPQEPDSAAASTIEEVRQGRGSMLDGTAMHEADEAQFSAALRRIARESELAPSAPIAADFSIPSLVPGPTAPEGAVLLRQAARELDSRAADNEDLQQFEEADHLRRLSTDLRREARRWDQRSQFTQ